MSQKIKNLHSISLNLLDTVISNLMKLASYLYHFVSEAVLQLLTVSSIEVLITILMFFV